MFNYVDQFHRPSSFIKLLLASNSSHVQLWRGSEEAFDVSLGVSNVFPNAAYVQIVVTYYILTFSKPDHSNKYPPSCIEMQDS